MNKAEKYKQKNPSLQMHLVDKKFGLGNLLIEFFYREQLNQFNQGFLAYVDKRKWEGDHHQVMNEVEAYLLETTGEINKQDFAFDMQEDGLECCINTSNDDCCEIHKSKFKEWFRKQFPKVDLEYGGVCHFDIVNF